MDFHMVSDDSMKHDVSMVSYGSTDHRHQRGPLPLYKPYTISSLSGSRGEGGKDDLRQQCRPLTSIWPSVPAQPQDVNMTSSFSTDHGQPHGRLW